MICNLKEDRTRRSRTCNLRVLANNWSHFLFVCPCVSQSRGRYPCYRILPLIQVFYYENQDCVAAYLPESERKTWGERPWGVSCVSILYVSSTVRLLWVLNVFDIWDACHSFYITVLTLSETWTISNWKSYHVVWLDEHMSHIDSGGGADWSKCRMCVCCCFPCQQVGNRKRRSSCRKAMEFGARKDQALGKANSIHMKSRSSILWPYKSRNHLQMIPTPVGQNLQSTQEYASLDYSQLFVWAWPWSFWSLINVLTLSLCTAFLSMVSVLWWLT